MSDDLDLEGTNDVADEPNAVEGASRRHQGRGDGQERVTGADGVDHLARNCRDRMHGPATLVRDAAMLAMGYDDPWTVDLTADPVRDIADGRDPVAHGQPRLGGVDAHEVGL